ncbi:MAG: four helix bundle protein [Chitinophagaceae bacterium]|nr:four helix bundle protein [Chitinophagaceae bacterium]
MEKKDNLILDLSFQFSLEIITFTEKLQQEKKFNLANQLFRSGTSIGASGRHRGKKGQKLKRRGPPGKF